MSVAADLRQGNALFPCEEEKTSQIRKDNEIITGKGHDLRAIYSMS